jgi:hypothetical protein
VAGVGAGQARRGGVDQGLRPDARMVPASWCRWPVAQVTGAETSARSCVPAATVVIHGLGCATVAGGGAAVAGRGRDEDPGVGGEQEGDLDRVAEVGARAADRVVDDVHAVGHGLVDRRQQVDAGAGAGGAGHRPAGLVGRDAGARRDAADAAVGRRPRR